MGKNSFGEIAQRWLAAQAPVQGVDGRWSGPIQPKTYADYEGLLRLLAIPKWGQAPIRDIDYPGLTDWYSELRVSGKQDGGPLSPSRLKRLHVVMHRVFSYAKKAGLAQTDPTELIEPRKDLPRKIEAKRPVALTHEELQALAAETGELEVMTLVIGYCGLRISEAVGLKLKHVVGQALMVEEATTYATGFGLHDKTTKSHRRRTVPIPDPVWEVFRPTLPTGSEDYVFPSRNGQMRQQFFSRRMEKAVERMQERVNQQREKEIAKTGQPATREFPRITPHDLRDTFASLAIQCGANVKVLQRLLGHADAAVTLNTYAEFFPDDIDTVAKALSAAITLRATQPI
jgi:integrase